MNFMFRNLSIKSYYMRTPPLMIKYDPDAYKQYFLIDLRLYPYIIIKNNQIGILTGYQGSLCFAHTYNYSGGSSYIFFSSESGTSAMVIML